MPGKLVFPFNGFFVHHSIADLFTTKLLLQVARLKGGDPSDEGTVVGPLIDQKAADRVEQWIAEAVAQGARVLLGGKRMGSVVEATVLSNVTPVDEGVLPGSVRAGGDRDALSPARRGD